MSRMHVLAATWAAAMTWVLSAGDAVGGPKPIKVGFSMALSASFRDWAKQVALGPPEYKSGDIIYPYATARK